jgi:hypothetical protein
MEVARRGAALLARAVAAVADGTALRTAQDATRATREPRPTARTCRVELTHWPPEPLWHFLSGVGGAGPFLRDAQGHALRHGQVRGWSGGALRAPGVAEPMNGGLRLHCRGGYVDVERAPLSVRLRARLQGSAAGR